VELFESAQKMVAGSAYYYFNTNRVTVNTGRYLAGSIHLYFILTCMKRNEVLETLLAFILILGIAFWATKNPYWLLAAAVLAVIGLLFKGLANKIYQAWSRISRAIGFVMNKVILTIVFIVFLVPLSILYKIFKKKNVEDGISTGSYFKNRNITYSKETLENIW
jgi:hypothetical protein